MPLPSPPGNNSPPLRHNPPPPFPENLDVGTRLADTPRGVATLALTLKEDGK
jgi:hypothetical protein